MTDSGKPMYKNTWVRANMQEITEKKKVKHQVGTQKVVKTKGLLKKTEFEVEEPIFETKYEWVGTGKFSDRYIDINDFANRITDACNKLYESGYEVISIIDTIEGKYSYQTRAGGMGQGGYGWGYGYGYSVSDGVVIISKLLT